MNNVDKIIKKAKERAIRIRPFVSNYSQSICPKCEDNRVVSWEESKERIYIECICGHNYVEEKE